MQRRDFLSASVGAAFFPQGRVLGANDRIRVALIGAGGRGRYDATQVKQARGAEVVAVSDVYAPRREKAVMDFGAPSEPVTDYRAILDRKDIDAVVIGAPDHWHAKMTLDAISAGKDVYVEKPVTHLPSEGDKLIQAVESSGRIVATGTQQRSWDHFLKAKEIIDSRQLGQIALVRCYWYQNYSLIKRTSDQQAPVDLAQLDWKQWLGSAPDQPFDPVKFRFWRFFWDFGGGIFTDLLVHWIDVIQWFMNSPRIESVQATGSTRQHTWMQAPDTVTATISFDRNYTVAFDSCLLGSLEGGGIVFRGEKAMMRLNRDGFAVYPEGVKPFEATGLPDPTVEMKSTGDGTRTNVENWLECIRSRKAPNANIRAAVEAASTCQLANQSMRERKIVAV